MMRASWAQDAVKKCSSLENSMLKVQQMCWISIFGVPAFKMQGFD